MAAAARQLTGKLKAYAALETKPEFLTGLLDAVDEFKRCCITVEQLHHGAQRCEGALAQKLEELSLLMEAYDALCQRGKRDPRDQMNWVLEELEDSNFAMERVFYIDGFPDFTRQHMAILEHLIRQSEQVTVSLNCDCVGSKLMAFEKAGQTAADIVKCAKLSGVPVKITIVPERTDALASVRQSLFQGKLQKQADLDGRLQLYTADSVYEECRGAAKQIMELVRGGCRYRDISVVCGDMTTYGPMIGLVFRRLGIPVYLSGTDDILNKSAVTTVLAALDAALDGFEQKAMLRYLRSVLSPIGPEQCDLVENYAIIWGVTGKAWTEPFKNHPEGLSGIWNTASERTIERIEQARCKVMEPLEKLQKSFRHATMLSQQVMAVYAFLEDIRLADRLMMLADELNQAGDNRSAQILNQLWEILLTALEQLYDVLGQTQWDDEAFRRLLILLLSQYDVGTIPAVLDSVTVGPVSAMRCQREKHLFILGAAEGSLPGYGGSSGVLTDQERDALRRLDISLTGGALEGIQAEFAEVYGVFCGASETVSLFCSGGQPSYVFRRLSELVGGEKQLDVSLVPTADTIDTAGILAKWDAADEAVKLDIQNQYNELCRRRAYELGSVSRENVSKLYGDKLTLSASQVDRQAECRLSYFLKYGLRARERKEATVDPAEFGTYVHAVLENTARDVMEQGGFHEVSLEDTLAIAKKHSDDYAYEHFSQLTSQRSEYLFRRNMQELDLVVRELWEELSTGKYAPMDFELHFGEGGTMPAIEVPSQAMNAALQGFVDRVDSFEVAGVKYFRVVDYKTGKKDFDYCDVFNGVGLQMLLYLFALEQEGQPLLGDKRIAAGVQYFPARVPYASLEGADEDEDKDRRANWKRRGLLLADELSLEAMDPEMSRLSCKRKKDGTLTGDLADREQLRQLRQYVFALLGKMVDEIASGKVEPNPYTRGSSHDACAFCPYGGICHKQSVPGRRNYKTMSSQRFWEEIEKEVKSHG
jgi:ATP-dependent helicase/nuclease subunit B